MYKVVIQLSKNNIAGTDTIIKKYHQQWYIMPDVVENIGI